MSRVLFAMVFVAAWVPVLGRAGPPADDGRRTSAGVATSGPVRHSCRSNYHRALADEKLSLAEGDRKGALEAVLRAQQEFLSCAPRDPAPREVENEICA